MSGTCACSETATGLRAEAPLEGEGEGGGLYPPPHLTQPESGDSEKITKNAID